ncbi:hypothetical protein IFM89_004383 [Coptis chinensis]|uniref:ZZ-type domain-containing protein n=1 Tax=Coptis chinensis TaxID=261450 RepID=A0A835I050_9MAGN|nr:hypothetical protein IFM89_004383 [Coptis chinensis]
MFPIVGERYKCNDCEEAIGFDLCGECYNTSSKLPGRFNQQHTPKHKFELVNSDLIRNIMRRLVAEHFEDSYAHVLSDDASEDLEDGHPSHAPSNDTPENQEGDSHSTAQSSLSLVVEVFNMESFVGTSENAASFLFNKLDYLVSRVKLKDVITKSDASSGDSNYVFQTYIESVETMLEDDVVTNKAIGSYGASFIKNTLKDSKNISILTHCNTGSLATAGYGTALGVIRALHTDRIRCKFALMKTGHVNLCHCRADRVAANGDTANKIGTYMLAFCALHHGIPFFVAAPVTSIFPRVKKLLSRKDLQRNS